MEGNILPYSQNYCEYYDSFPKKGLKQIMNPETVKYLHEYR